MENNKENKNFFVDLIKKIEDFDFDIFKKNKQIKKDKNQKNKEIEQELKDSEKTIGDVSKQRKSHLKHIVKRVFLVGFITMLITAAVIMSLQDNEQKARKSLKTKDIFKDQTSFGSIDEKDYITEQNILNDRINKVYEKSDRDINEIKSIIINESTKTRLSTKNALNDLEIKQINLFKNELNITKAEIIADVDNKIKVIEQKQVILENNLKKVKTYKATSNLQLSNGKIVFPNLNPDKKNTTKTIVVKNSKANNIKIEELVEIEEDVYFEEEISITIKTDIQTNFSTSLLDTKIKKKFKPFKIHLTTSMVEVTLLEGVKAAVSMTGLSEPSPVLMIIEDVLYTANDTIADLKGCFLRGVGVGNINTSRVEIFGTHLSCIIVANDGKQYKIEHTFPQNKVWIKGEDGGTGIQGQIVDSSGKLLAKGAAIGFMQGLSNFFLSNAQTTLPITAEDGTVSYTQALNNSLQNGVATGVNSGFEMSLKKYEQILEGYYPFVDTKGGRRGLTAVFGGEIELEIKEYYEPNIEKLRFNNLSRGY